MANISSLYSNSMAMRPNPFSRIDTNSDQKVTKDEFVAGRPRGVSESDASSLFAKIDSQSTGSLTEEQLSKGMKANKPSHNKSAERGSLSSEMLSAVMNLLQEIGNISNKTEANANNTSAFGAPPSASEMFKKIDTDRNGSVNKEEFLAAKPKGVSKEQALELYNSIDTKGTGSISLEQFEKSLASAGVSGSNRAGGAGGPPPPPPGGSGDSSATSDPRDTNKDGKVSMSELMAGLSKNTDSSNNTGNALLTQLSNALKSYNAQQNINLDSTLFNSKSA